MNDMNRYNPTFERLDLQNAHVIEWKWFLQETRGFHWYRNRCWAHTELSNRT